MSNSIDSWNINDPNADRPLEEIHPPSARALSLVARNRAKPLLKIGFINVTGAIEMLEGLEYHYDNTLRICHDLANGILISDKCLDHEAVAYKSRLGQFYYFAKSKFVKNAISDFTVVILTILKFLVFRMKHAAHRSMDAPRGESEEVRLAHA